MPLDIQSQHPDLIYEDEDQATIEPQALSFVEPEDFIDNLAECFPGYLDCKLLYASNKLYAIGAKEAVRGDAVFLKACLENDSTNAMSRIRHEWHCQLAVSEIAGVKIPRALEACNNNKGLMLVFSNDGERASHAYFHRDLEAVNFSNPRSQQQYITSGIDLNKFLKFAVEVVTILDQLHKRGISHCNINPFSIGVDVTDSAMVFDLSCCTFLEKEDAQPSIISSRQLPFMSPESSGRINRSIDYRSDFYSLGICFYFLLTGRCPFTSDNALDLIYQHIAHTATPPHEVCPQVPRCLSDVVLKLMEKTAEDRYQTGQGLISDLLKMQAFSEQAPLHSFNTFVPGLADEASQFSIPQKLFGRDDDIKSLLHCFDEVKQNGGCNVAIIKGGSGTGKSSLVREIHRPVLESKSFFASGKFDQYKRGLPFFSLIQAGGELVRQLVSESESKLEEWKSEILASLGGDASAVFRVLPELQQLYGEDVIVSEMAQLGPAEREARFTAAFSRFILAFAKRGSPLVLFLDDVQWSSVAEMNLIANLAIAAKEPVYSFTLVVAYRDNEVLDGHHALTMLRTITDADVPVRVIEVKSMTLEAVRDMVAASLRTSADKDNVELETLTKLILAKTDGNAFFITQLLKSLHEKDHLFYDFGISAWKFDLAAILREDLPMTVVDLLLTQIQQLPQQTRHCLQMAACIGTNRFSLLVLAIVTEQRLKFAARNLWEALQSGLIVPTSSAYKEASYKLADDDNMDMEMDFSVSGASAWSEEERATAATYRFLHDRVQQASYQLLPDADRPKTHLTIGFRLLAYFQKENSVDNYIYEIVNQINRGIDVLQPEQIVTAIELNLQAGKRALQSTAFDAAMQYLETAYKLAPESWWQSHFELMLDISLSHVDATYAVQNYHLAAESLKHIASKARNAMEKAQIMYRMIDVYMGLDDLSSAIEMGLQGMELLGVKVPRTAEAADAIMNDLRPKLDLSTDEIDLLATVGLTTDPAITLLQSLATSVSLPIYLSKPALLQAITGTIFHMSLQHGVSEAGAYPLIMYALTITHTQPTVRSRLQGYHLGLAAVKIVDKTSATKLSATTPKVLKVFASHISWWNEPTRACLVYFNSTISIGVQVFNVEYTCYAYTESCSYSFWSGEPLPSVVARMSSYIPLIQKYKQKQSTLYCSIQLQGYIALMSETSDPAEIDGEYFSVALEFDALIAIDSHAQIFVYYLAKLLVATYFHRPVEVAQDLIATMSQYEAGAQGTCYIAKYHFLICSSLVRNYQTLSATEHAMFFNSLQKLKFFASGSPSSFTHEISFLDAELLSHENKDLDALEKYELSYSQALSVGNIHEAGHFAERTYLWLEGKNKNLAKKYLLKAYDCFKSAGFRAKCSDLRSHYPDILNKDEMIAHVSDELVPFRSVNMQMNRDGTLSKLTNVVDSPVSRTQNDKLDDTQDDDHQSYAARTELSAQSRGSRRSKASLHLRAMPPQNLSQTSQNSPSDLTPTGTMSSYVSRPKLASLGASKTRSSLHSSHDASSGSSEDVKRSVRLEGGKDFDLDVALKASVLISDVLQVSEVLKRLIETVLMNAGADYGVLLLVDKASLYIEATGRNSAVNIVPHQLLTMNSDVVPCSMVNYVSRLRETTVLGSGQDHNSLQAKFGKDPYFRNKRIRSVMCMPVQNSIKLIGVLYLENSSTAYTFGPRRVELLNFLCTQAAIAIEKARLYSDLEVAKDEAQASNKMKSEFLSTISHEIRTPFNAVLGMSGFLLDTQLSPMQIDYVETIRNSSKELLRVIDDILDFSKMEHGAFELHKEDFSLRECIEGAMQITAERAASKELELAYFSQNDFPDIIVNDITRFRQVVINLLGNSIKFTERGSVTLSSDSTLLRGATPTENAVYRLQISVKDTGIGIKEEDHRKLFKLFSQIDSSLARNFSGTGLGLAISEKLVRLMNGQIWVESSPGQGSTFHFTIVTEVKSSLKSNAHPLSAKLKHLGALVLDDSDVASRSLRESLEWLGMRVTTVRSVEELLEVIGTHQKGTFKVALIDLHYGLADSILPKLESYDPDCKILRLSRFGFRQQFDEKYQYLTKPVKRERLAKVVGEAIFPEIAESSKTMEVPDVKKFSPLGMATKHPLRILLAEDNLINSRVALQHLKRMGYTAVHAKDGQYCLEEEDKAIYDVILMDVQMPRLDGCQAATKLRAKYVKEPSRCPRIIAMTANAMRGDRERCLESGMHAYCPKPIIVEALAQQLLQSPRRSE